MVTFPEWSNPFRVDVQWRNYRPPRWGRHSTDGDGIIYLSNLLRVSPIWELGVYCRQAVRIGMRMPTRS